MLEFNAALEALRTARAAFARQIQFDVQKIGTIVSIGSTA
jgi:hypothetical protein